MYEIVLLESRNNDVLIFYHYLLLTVSKLSAPGESSEAEKGNLGGRRGSCVNLTKLNVTGSPNLSSNRSSFKEHKSTDSQEQENE